MSSWNYIDWAEKAGMENLKGRIASGDALLSHANQLLTILLTGMAGALAWGVRIFSPGAGPVEWGAAAVSAYLALLACLLVQRCIATRLTQTLHNEPKNVYRPDLNLSELEIRTFELENVQARIEATKTRNQRVAWWLDACRFAAAATPLIFAATALIKR